MEASVSVRNLEKIYPLYSSKRDRVLEALSPIRKKRHEDFYALKGISFDIFPGECVGILGDNGSGKSTLLKVLSGVLSKTAGDIQVVGIVSALLELGAGFNPEYTGIENIYLSGTIVGLSEKDVEEKLEDIIEFADIGNFIYQPVKSYSSGMFARLAFAVAIHVNPDILIVDEALSVGDQNFQNKCLKAIHRFISSGKTAIFVSHAMPIIRMLCTRCIWMKHGEIILDGDTEYVTGQYEHYVNSKNNYRNMVLPSITKASSILCSNKDTLRLGTVADGPAHFADIRILDDKGFDCTSFCTGDTLEIQLYLRVTQPISDISIGVVISTSEGIEISRINNIRDDHSISLEVGINCVSMKINILPLLTGDYNISFYLANSNFTESYHRIENFYHFNMDTPFAKCGWRKFDGIVAINHCWTNTRLEE